ncbi:MAG: preprotein translocase subunit SecE [Ignavibacteriales bacterium]|nr:preprotein translocase subunit SecE [Ignavibacteriales bacterium]
MKEKIISYSTEVTKELNKVTWPTRDELKDSTLIVATVCIILSLFVFAIDTILTQVITSIF